MLVGANLCIAHPILWERMCRNPNDPEIVVVDPRRTETALASTQHYAIAPKSDLRFFYAIAQILIEREWIDREFIDAHTEGFDAFARHVSRFRPEDVCDDIGLPVSELIAKERCAGRPSHRTLRQHAWPGLDRRPRRLETRRPDRC